MNNKLKELEEKLPKNCCSFCSHLSLKGPNSDYKYDIKCVIFNICPKPTNSCEFFEPEYTTLSTENLDTTYINFLETCLRISYEDYLNSIYWKLFKEKVLFECNHKCSICGSSENLDVYHIQKNLGRESLSDVIVLCLNCKLDSE